MPCTNPAGVALIGKRQIEIRTAFGETVDLDGGFCNIESLVKTKGASELTNQASITFPIVSHDTPVFYRFVS